MPSTITSTVLIIPGLRDHVAEHWQTLLERQLIDAGVKVRSVPPLETDKLNCSARVEAIQSVISTLTGPVIIVAHSGGVIMIAHWAKKFSHPSIKGALLAVPPDFEAQLPAGYPTLEALDHNGWLPIPRSSLPFHCLVVASTNDPLASLPSVEAMARNWQADLVNIGAVGHLNPASGYGEWPQALEFIHQLER